MKKLKVILISICLLLNLQVVKAQENEYKIIYLDYLSNINSKYQQILFYDIDKNNIPEMIFCTKEYNVHDPYTIYSYDIYTIKNNKMEKIFNIEFKEKFWNRLIFFTTNNDDNLYVGKNDINNNYNMKYYRLEYVEGNIIPKLIAETQNDFFENEKIGIIKENNCKYFYENIEVSESEFINKFNFRQTIPYIYLGDKEEIEKAIDNFNKIPSNPTFVEIKIPYNSDIRYITYNNGLYDIFNIDSNKYILMINGNIIPKVDIQKDDDIFLPLRLICNYMNKKIIYNPQDKTIEVDNIIINQNESKVNNEHIDIKNINGSIYLPLNFFENYFIINDLEFYGTYNKPVTILSLEDKSINLDYTSVEEAQKLVINNSKENNNPDIYTFTNASKIGDLGRYYIFKIDYKYSLYKNEDRYIEILYDKYSNNMYALSKDIQQFINNKINLYI